MQRLGDRRRTCSPLPVLFRDHLGGRRLLSGRRRRDPQHVARNANQNTISLATDSNCVASLRAATARFPVERVTGRGGTLAPRPGQRCVHTLAQTSQLRAVLAAGRADLTGVGKPECRQ